MKVYHAHLDGDPLSLDGMLCASYWPLRGMPTLHGYSIFRPQYALRGGFPVNSKEGAF
jgi:hypothetical protein